MADLDAALRALLTVAPPDRPGTARALIAAARTADKYRKRLHRAHPLFGTGSLLSAAGPLASRKGLQSLGDDQIAALLVLLGALRDDRDQHRSLTLTENRPKGLSDLPS